MFYNRSKNEQITLFKKKGILLAILSLHACVNISASQSCMKNKDFKYAKLMAENQDTAPYIETFFSSQTCDIKTSINNGRECYIYCNSGLESCVGFSYIGSDCYICDNNTNTQVVPQNLRSGFHVWKSHVLSLDPCAITPCQHGRCIKVPGSFECVCERHFGGRLCDECENACGLVTSSFCIDGMDTLACTCIAGNHGGLCDGEIQCTDAHDLLSYLEESAFTASSEYSTEDCAACSLLTNQYGWSPRNELNRAWIKVHLGQTCLVNEIHTKGLLWRGDEQYVTKFKLSTRNDGNQWHLVRDELDNVIIFDANTDSDTTKIVEMPYPLIASRIKLTVVDYIVWPTLKWGIFGCPLPA